MIVVIVWLVLSLSMGGKPFRWFGQKAEEAGKTIKQKSEKVAEEADKVKEQKKAIEEGVKELEKLKDKVLKK
jgi:hypothetical protein